MNKFKTFAAAVAVILGFACSAQAQILYKVEKTGSDKVSYLLGTHHLAPLSTVDSIAELPAIMKNIDRLYGELVMSQMNDTSVMMGLRHYLVAPPDSTLDKVLSPAQLDSVRTVWNEYTGGTAPLELMFMVKPSLISTQLSAMMAAKVLPQLNPLEGIDMTMQNRATALGKPVCGLETMEFQMKMLYNSPISEQAESLMEVVSNIAEQESKAIALSEAYLNHDIDKILDIMLEMEKEDADAIERMIYSRNDNWVKQLTAEMPERSLMVVVGAGHLPGERGVIAGLRKAGYTVTPIK